MSTAEHSRFHDMEIRVVNSARRDDFSIESHNPGASWPYGALYIYEEGGKKVALFGDLRIGVSAQEEARLRQIIDIRNRGIFPNLALTDLGVYFKSVADGGLHNYYDRNGVEQIEQLSSGALPCPFCSEKPLLVRHGGPFMSWSIKCNNECCAIRPETRFSQASTEGCFWHDKTKVIEAWNTRKS